MIIPLYQPLGSSSHHLAKQLGQQLDQPTTHTGTLDPMAAGVLICLSGSDRFMKAEYSNWLKTYQFSILVGFSTDSHDLLGLVSAVQPENKTDSLIKELQKQLTTFQPTYHQVIPTFSARRHQGKSSFDWAKNKEEIPEKKEQVSIQSFKLISESSITADMLNNYLTTRIAKLSGYFRQQEIISNWQKKLSSIKKQHRILPLYSFEVTCSKRTYVRGLVRDLSKQAQIPLTTFHIVRTKNGPYSIADSQCLTKQSIIVR